MGEKSRLMRCNALQRELHLGQECRKDAGLGVSGVLSVPAGELGTSRVGAERRRGLSMKRELRRREEPVILGLGEWLRGEASSPDGAGDSTLHSPSNTHSQISLILNQQQDRCTACATWHNTTALHSVLTLLPCPSQVRSAMQPVVWGMRCGLTCGSWCSGWCPDCLLCSHSSSEHHWSSG